MLGMLAATRHSGRHKNPLSTKGIPQCNNSLYTLKDAPTQQLAVMDSECIVLRIQPCRDHASRDPTETKLTEFFNLCQVDDFARTLYYMNVPRYYTSNKKSWCKELSWMYILVLKKHMFLVECTPSVHAKGTALIFDCC